MKALLSGVPIFAGLTPEAIALLLENARELEFGEGAVVVREGETSNRFFVIAVGRLRVCRNFGQPGEVDLASLGPKEFFGEMSILDTLPRSATIQAMSPSTLCCISSITFARLYQSMPTQYGILILNIARDLSRRLRHLDEVFAARH